MKRVIIFIVLGAITVPGNAQFFIEGSIGVDCTGSKSENDGSGNKSSESSISSIWISPQAGYWLNDNIAVGTRITISNVNSKGIITDTDNPGSKLEQESRNTLWRVSAFGRYRLWGTKKFSLLLDGSIYYEKEKHTSITEWEELDTKTSVSISKVGIQVFPSVSYSLNEKFSIITRCNFLNMELYSLSTGGKNRTNYFTFGAKSDIFSSLANVNIGFIYNF